MQEDLDRKVEELRRRVAYSRRYLELLRERVRSERVESLPLRSRKAT